MNAVTIPVSPTSIRFVPASDRSTAARQWADGVAFADRPAKVDGKGRPLQRFAAVVDFGGSRLGTITVETPQPLPESVPLGAVYQPQGEASLTIANNREGYDLRASLHCDGFEQAKG